MIATGDFACHEEAWLALPWLANGRLSQTERDKIEPHVRQCSACKEELAFQRLICDSLTAPDRVTYAPGPSFRKLMDRIDGTAPRPQKTGERSKVPASPGRAPNRGKVSPWRPPGLAWAAASFALVIGFVGVLSTVYRSSELLYTTHTDTARATPNILHIAFDRSLTIGEAEEALRSTGARIVEGPDSTGVIGIRPVASGAGDATSAGDRREMRVLSARLRADPRVRWVEPILGGDSPGERRAPLSRGQ
ncbi:MAG: zf-HC2 protein [Gammaproteobacteria bacterium]|nr:zf-HC2 protein [Gammaproteobacteria bacterium]